MQTHRFIVVVEDEDGEGWENIQSTLAFAIESLVGSCGEINYVDSETR